MIKIVKHGVFGAERIHKGECPVCKCKFTFQVSDTRYDSGGGRESPSYILKCPEIKCNNEIWIDASLVK